MPAGYHFADGSKDDQFGFILDSANHLGGRLDYLGRPRQGTTAAPTVATGAAVGTTGNGAAVSAKSGTDSHGTVTIHAATTGTGPGAICTITFANPYLGTNPPIVQIEPKDAGANLFYWASCTNTVLTINVVGTPTASANLAFDYYVTGGA